MPDRTGCAQSPLSQPPAAPLYAITVHGWFQKGADNPSFFLWRVQGKNLNKPHSSLASIQAILKTGDKDHKCRSFVGADAIHEIADLKDKYPKNGGSGLLSLASLEMLEEEGPPWPMEASGQKAGFGSHGPAISWAESSLDTNGDMFELALTHPRSRETINLTLGPFSKGFDITKHVDPKNHDDKVRVHPGLILKGSPFHADLNGRAWVEYGPLAPWRNEPEERLNAPCRVNLSISLDSDQHIMLRAPWNSKQNKSLPDAWGAILSDRGKKRVGLISLRARDLWLSPDTWISYPISWHLFMPEIQADLEITPLVTGQEIPLAGPDMALWSGAAKVRGNVAGKKVRGWCRVFLEGFGGVFGLGGVMENMSRKIDRHLRAFLPQRLDEPRSPLHSACLKWPYPEKHYRHLVSRPAWELLGRGGKRWRPILGMLLLEALGVKPAPYEDLLSVLAELPHTGALIIDDIQDKSRIRRNGPCIHLLYGQEISINLGNLLYFLPFELLSRHPALSESQRLEAFKIISNQFVGAHLGQGMDLILSGELSRENLTPEHLNRLEKSLLKLYAQKTGGILEGIAATACVIAQSEPALQKAATDFAADLGVAFQITDDVLNFSDSPDWTKKPGEDIEEGKITSVLIQALRLLDHHKAVRLCDIVTTPHLRNDPAYLGKAVELVYDSGALPDCLSLADRIFERCWHKFSGLLKPSRSKIMLCALLKKLLYRNR